MDTWLHQSKPQGADLGARGWVCLGLLDWCRHGRFARCVVVVMSAAKHTPGPWFVSTATHLTLGAILAVSAKEGDGVDAVCIVDLLPGDEESKANARLISASPDLLEALQSYSLPIDLENIALSCIEFGSEAVNRELRRRAAIAKAEGGAA
jgi:hypothetical protein